MRRIRGERGRASLACCLLGSWECLFFWRLIMGCGFWAIKGIGGHVDCMVEVGSLEGGCCCWGFDGVGDVVLGFVFSFNVFVLLTLFLFRCGFGCCSSCSAFSCMRTTYTCSGGLWAIQMCDSMSSVPLHCYSGDTFHVTGVPPSARVYVDVVVVLPGHGWTQFVVPCCPW